ncbi:L,D-transpeptidase [Nitrospinaceae bacterium]|nr:L,D-transpeptidase [Nitrospinaceae bacterium]
MAIAEKIKTLTITEFNLIANKDPYGSYDRRTRETLQQIIYKLVGNPRTHTDLERKLFYKFRDAKFGALEKKSKQVKLEVTRYRLSSNAKHSIKLLASALGVLILFGYITYEFILDMDTRQRVDIALNDRLNKVGLVSKKGMDKIRQTLQAATAENEQLNQVVEQMIYNDDKAKENLKYILKEIYNKPKTRYIKTKDLNIIKFGKKEIRRYKDDPKLWYVLGVVQQGVMRIFYANEEVLQIRAIFGRSGEETPVGNYLIKNRSYKPTWYKKEDVNGQIKVRAIPFGAPDHELGHWWLGMKKLGNPVPGSYGIHGVNAGKVNEFYKKNFDWRNGSAGCPNIQEWYLHFLGKVLPIGTKVNIVSKDKWDKNLDLTQAASAA